jgi:hypothetical protein
MQLLRDKTPNYAWRCSDQCLPSVDTGVSVSESITEFENRLAAYAPHTLVLAPNLSQGMVSGGRVYALHILSHFIECSWGGCYNSIYSNFFVFYFESVTVLDYVLRSPVVGGEVVIKNGVPEPRIFGELYSRLNGIQSHKVREYLKEKFPFE